MDNSTYEMIENGARSLLSQIETVDLNTKEGKEALTKATHLVELLITLNKDASDYEDKAERRRIEEERNKAMAEIEQNKQKLTWGRVGLEMAKVVVPMLISLAGYDVFQKRILKFEETGRISSTAGRELHLPKFFK